jgi:hypothetical protein
MIVRKYRVWCDPLDLVGDAPTGIRALEMLPWRVRGIPA